MKTTVDEAMAASSAIRKSRTLPGYLGIYLRGFLMGSADVVPGVSGGTMAFITGIYEELIDSIRAAGRPVFWKALLRLHLKTALQLLNWLFLLALFLGIVSAVITLAPGIEWTLKNQPVLIWSFFFGLILASVLTVSRHVQTWTPSLWVALIAGAVGAFWLVGLVPTQTPDTWWFLFFAGALAICAMILPGISGSFILVLLGKYEFFVSAVNQRDLGSLAIAGAGAVIGLVAFTQLLGWLFRHYHDLTVAVLTGFMLGSLRKVWPWKEVLATTTDRHGVEVPSLLKNVLPPVTVNGAFNFEIVYALALAALGFTIVLIIDGWANRKLAEAGGAVREA